MIINRAATCAGSAAPAGRIPRTSDATLCYRAVVLSYTGAISVCVRGQQHQRALHLLRAMQRFTIVPDVIPYMGAVRVCREGQRHQQALHLLRAMQRHAIVPDVITYTAAISACGKGQQYPQRRHRPTKLVVMAQPALHLFTGIQKCAYTCGSPGPGPPRSGTGRQCVRGHDPGGGNLVVQSAATSGSPEVSL